MTLAPRPLLRAFPLEGGVFIAVVGQSGVGKDSVIDYARAVLGQDDRFHFARRAITRPRDGLHEDHDPVDAKSFDAEAARGAFALHWSAHGQCYGIPVVADDHVERGAVVVANLSRTVLPSLAARYRRHMVAEIVAEADVIARRLEGRRREAADQLAGRLSRMVAVERRDNHRVIDNSGDLAAAGAAFVSMLIDQTRPRN